MIEDDPSARNCLVAILEDDGYRVLAVADGPTAFSAVEAFRPDLALIDGGLPGPDGAEVARRLRQAADLPIIFVTGADSADDIHRAFKVGADDYIVKPFDPEELSWRVRAVLRRSGHSVAQVWECGELVVDEGTRSVTMCGSGVASELIGRASQLQRQLRTIRLGHHRRRALRVLFRTIRIQARKRENPVDHFGRNPAAGR